MHSPFETYLANGIARLTRFAVIGDNNLRPLPGVDLPEQTETSTPNELETV